MSEFKGHPRRLTLRIGGNRRPCPWHSHEVRCEQMQAFQRLPTLHFHFWSAFVHMLPVDVQIVARIVFVKKKEGNKAVSSKKMLKENRLSLIDQYQVFVNACKISGDSDVIVKSRKWKSALFFTIQLWIGLGNRGKMQKTWETSIMSI